MSAARTLTDAELAALLDAKQVAESLRVQPNAVTKMARRGVLPIAGPQPPPAEIPRHFADIQKSTGHPLRHR